MIARPGTTTTKLLSLAAAGALIFSACGGDDDGGGGSDAKDAIFNEMMAGINEGGDTEGVTIDEGCIRSAIDELPDDQAEIIAANLDALDSPDIPDGVDVEAITAMTTAMFDCIEIDFDGLLDE